MRKIAGLLCVVGMSVSAANAGTASFQGLGDRDPSTPNVLDIDPGTAASMIVGVGTATGTFDAVSLLMGSDLSGLNMSFVYNFQPLDTTLPPTPPSSFGVFASDLFVGGNRLGVTPQWTAPLQVGTLTIDTSNAALFPEGSSFEVFISAAREEAAFGSPISSVALGAGLPEGLNGSITVHVVPEPATIGLLGLASLAMLRRRKVA